VAFKIEFYPEAARDFDSLDGSVQKEVGKKIDALGENPFLGKPLGNKLGLDLAGFYKLYAFRKKTRIVCRTGKGYLEVIEIIGISKRDKEEIYKLIVKRLENPVDYFCGIFKGGPSLTRALLQDRQEEMNREDKKSV